MFYIYIYIYQWYNNSTKIFPEIPISIYIILKFDLQKILINYNLILNWWIYTNPAQIVNKFVIHFKIEFVCI